MSNEETVEEFLSEEIIEKLNHPLIEIKNRTLHAIILKISCGLLSIVDIGLRYCFIQRLEFAVTKIQREQKSDFAHLNWLRWLGSAKPWQTRAWGTMGSDFFG